MARRRCAPISNASRANSWRRTSSSPRKPPSTTPRRSIRPRGACSSRPSSRKSAAIAIAVIGQAFPYVPIAHPKRFTPDWKFGIRDEELQKLVDAHRSNDKVDAVILLSHNGMDVDLKLASRVTGIDVILGGHTHDAVPQPVAVDQCRRRHARHQCRLERQVSGACSTSNCRQGQGRQCALPAAAGVLGIAEARSPRCRR